MKKILVIGASNSPSSINKQLAVWAAEQIQDAELTILDLNDFELPLYHPQRHKEGIPELAQAFYNHISDCDGVVISFAEHNGSYTAAFKNIYDWASVINSKTWQEKPLFLMATSPGGRGGISVLDAAAARFPHMGGQVLATFSLPSFGQNFDDGISNDELLMKFKDALDTFAEGIG
ncbi:MAG: NAD(P)H-dependent oxidoreductase [Bacteroidota bacterium]